jgi:putative flippase GtrA
MSIAGFYGEGRAGTALERLPRPLRFLAVGSIGLLTDLAVLSLLLAFGLHPLIARLISITLATFVTWRLNRVFTFDRSDRHQGEEAVRYGLVTVAAQATSYAIFAALTMSIAAHQPQAALAIGAAIVALMSYTGHRWFAFAPPIGAPQSYDNTRFPCRSTVMCSSSAPAPRV